MLALDIGFEPDHGLAVHRTGGLNLDRGLRDDAGRIGEDRTKTAQAGRNGSDVDQGAGKGRGEFPRFLAKPVEMMACLADAGFDGAGMKGGFGEGHGLIEAPRARDTAKLGIASMVGMADIVLRSRLTG